MNLKPNIYKKKNPRKPFIKQIILYSISLIISLLIRQWLLVLVFLALIAFSGFMLYRKRDAGSYSLADYIHSYDESFPTEDPEGSTKKEKKELADKRKQEYEDHIAKIEAEYDSYDYGEDEFDEEGEDEDE